MRYLLLPIALLAFTVAGCEGDVDRPTNDPEMRINTDRGVDLNPKTDHDIKITPPDIDIGAKNDSRGVPDIDIDVKKPADRDTLPNESEPTGRDTE